MNISSCQHVDFDGRTCPSDSYLCCPHCQLNLCLKHINFHQDEFQRDFVRLCENIDRTKSTLEHLTFDPHQQRDQLIKELDRWRDEEIRLIEHFYFERRKQIEILLIKSQMQFDIFKCQKEKQLNENLQKHVRNVFQQNEIHRDDFDQIESKLKSIQRGLEELQHLNIYIRCRPSQYDVQVYQSPYVEAAKSLFDDDESKLWKSNVHDELNFIHSVKSSLLTTNRLRILPVVKRLQNPTRTTLLTSLS